MGIFSKLFMSKENKEKYKKMELGLKNSKASFSSLSDFINSKDKLDNEFYSTIEEILITSDMGLDYTLKYIDNLKKAIKNKKISDIAMIKDIMLDTFYEMYFKDNSELNINSNGTTVYLFMGVNGSGKTTSIAKLAYKLKAEGKSVCIAAADTFRAGAREQLKVWGDKIDIPVVINESMDPASTIFDALKYSKENNIDYLLCDTAGRLQNKVNLMKELEKIYRVIGREINGAPHEAFLVIDSTTGQNGLSQAKVFNESCKVSGVILTKLDGTSKGGIALSINNSLSIPIKFYGFGEKETDFDMFDIDSYFYTLFKDVLFNEE